MRTGPRDAKLSRFETLKGRWLALGVTLVLGVAVFSPAIRSPLFLDDYLHVAMVEGTFPGERGPFDLYDFVDDGARAELFARGLVPWWTHPELTIRFFRPLSSALLWGLHRATGHDALLMHLHSVGWWLAAVLAVRAVYRRFFSERVAALATAIFALSPCHFLPLAWIANSESLVALAFGAGALLFHARYRLGGTAAHAALASALFTLALLGGGEYALALGGYVLALEIARRRTRPASLLGHAAGLLPFAVPAASYLVVRSALRYGAVASGFYTDPFNRPLAFLAAAPHRVAALLADGWLTLGSDAYVSTAERWGLGVVVVAIAVALVHPIRSALAVLEPEAATVGRALAAGSVLALVPTLAVVPAFRLLGIAMIGVAATSALVLEEAWFSARGAPDAPPTRWRSLVTAGALLLGFTQLVHGPVTSFVASAAHRREARKFLRRAADAGALVGALAAADVGIVRGMSGTFFTPFALDPRGVQPARWRVLAQAGHILALRQDERTIELVVAHDRSLYPSGAFNLYREPGSPLRAGDVVRTAGMTVTVLDVGPLGPRRARFVFDEALEVARWMTDDFDAAVAAELPAVGQGAPFDP